MADLGRHSHQVDQAHRLVQAPPNEPQVSWRAVSQLSRGWTSHFPRNGAMIPDSNREDLSDTQGEDEATPPDPTSAQTITQTKAQPQG